MPKSATTKHHERVNKTRRERYKNDASYRDQTKQRFRRYYRETHEVVLAKNCEPNIGNAKSFGKKRDVLCKDGEHRKIVCLNLREMCEALGGYFLDNLRDWIYKGMFPRPIHNAAIDGTGKSRMGVFTVKEANILLDVFAEQQKVKAYYTKKDTGTRDALFARVNAQREREGYGVEDT